MSNKIIVHSTNRVIQKIPLPFLNIVHNVQIDSDTSNKNNKIIDDIINSREKIKNSGVKNGISRGNKFNDKDLKAMITSIGLKPKTHKHDNIKILMDFIDEEILKRNKNNSTILRKEEIISDNSGYNEF
jgi:hypothetical protein